MEIAYWLVMFVSVAACVWFYTRHEVLKQKSTALAGDKAQLGELLSLSQKEASVLREKVAGLEAHKDVTAKAQEAMKIEFQNTANKLFEEVSSKFSKQSEEKIGGIIKPLQDRMIDFQKKVDDAFGTQGKEQHTLKAEIEKIVKMNEQMRFSTESLTKALRGDVKTQGDWGEVILERILEESGLQEGIGYTLQGAQMGMKDASGNAVKPDVVVHLPDQKHLIVDAKVSLKSYELYASEVDELQKTQHIKDFLRSVRNHVGMLASKDYAAHDKIASPDFVFLFMPIEGAFTLAMQQDRDLHQFAWEKKIAIVCPTTLFASLKTVSSVWRIEMQNRNTLEIARQAGALYDKFVALLEDLDDVGKKLQQADKSYDDAMNKLKSGKGNLVSRVENIKALGVRTNKALPKELLLTADAED